MRKEMFLDLMLEGYWGIFSKIKGAFSVKLWMGSVHRWNQILDFMKHSQFLFILSNYIPCVWFSI